MSDWFREAEIAKTFSIFLEEMLEVIKSRVKSNRNDIVGPEDEVIGYFVLKCVPHTDRTVNTVIYEQVNKEQA
jgi:hypothetical protein